IVSGLDQAFKLFLTHAHLAWALPLIIILIVLGSFGAIAAWVIGPSKGLAIAADDGCAAKWLQQRNKKNVPVAILLVQLILVIAICSLFLVFKSISTSYWILSDLTSQLALLFYVFFFAAGIKLRFKTAKNPLAYRIPGGPVGIWIAGILGILTCVIAIALGFLPPNVIPIGNTFVYEGILIGGVVIFTIIPLIIYALNRQKNV
nr:APC family permease [Gammaproteobacteria bacterium]